MMKSRIDGQGMWHVWGKVEVYTVLVGKPEGKRPLVRLRHISEDNIKTYLEEVLCGGMGWIDLAHDRDRWWALVNAVMKLRVLGKCGEFLD
jgi:hypothetical protein